MGGGVSEGAESVRTLYIYYMCMSSLYMGSRASILFDLHMSIYWHVQTRSVHIADSNPHRMHPAFEHFILSIERSCIYNIMITLEPTICIFRVQISIQSFPRLRIRFLHTSAPVILPSKFECLLITCHHILTSKLSLSIGPS